MPDKPRLWLSNFASRNSKGHHGPGRLLSIMRLPRPQYGELGEGHVNTFAPPEWLLLDVKKNRMTFQTYVRALQDIWSLCYGMKPGELVFVPPGGSEYSLVANGDTLACCCARGAPCHRILVADFLVRVGWQVTLDGRDVNRDDVAQILKGVGG